MRHLMKCWSNYSVYKRVKQCFYAPREECIAPFRPQDSIYRHRNFFDFLYSKFRLTCMLVFQHRAKSDERNFIDIPKFPLDRFLSIIRENPERLNIQSKSKSWSFGKLDLTIYDSFTFLFPFYGICWHWKERDWKGKLSVLWKASSCYYGP